MSVLPATIEIFPFFDALFECCVCGRILRMFHSHQAGPTRQQQQQIINRNYVNFTTIWKIA
jgi:hypothetical protein